MQAWFEKRATSTWPRARGLLRRVTLRLCLPLLLMGAPAAQAGEALVAVAANFAGPMARIAEGFRQATGHELKLSAGPTGRFYTQITAGGAPFDVLISADDETPRRLIGEGYAVPGTAFTYAIGQLVLWSPRQGLVDDEGRVLASLSWRKLAIANAKVAPYGKAAMQLLQAQGLAAQVRPRLVTGESVAQAYQFVLSGNAEMGLVALSQIQQPGKPMVGSHWRVPQRLYSEVRQDAVLLKRGENNPAARALLDYLKTPAARTVMQAYGYQH